MLLMDVCKPNIILMIGHWKYTSIVCGTIDNHETALLIFLTSTQGE
jgi:hypothetical protein